MKKYFVDYGNFKITNDQSEILIRVNEKGKISNLCCMSNNDSIDPLADAYMIVSALNNMPE